jgi:GxxExxY protein
MNADETRMGRLARGETASRILGAAFEVHNTLGHGFLEKVYRRSLQVELIRRSSKVKMEIPIKVLYKQTVVGDCCANLFVDGCVIVEIKVANCYTPEDEAQLLNEQGDRSESRRACQLRTRSR